MGGRRKKPPLNGNSASGKRNVLQGYYSLKKGICQVLSTKHDISELRQLQALPLDMKIKLTERRIRDWYNYWAGAVYISFSGGKDSTVLLNIARNIYPDIEAVFVNTGLEYPEIQAFVKTFDNVKILFPEKTFVEVLKKYGYPVLSKEISHNVGVAKRNPNGKIIKRNFYSESRGRYSYKRYIPMLSMDFMPSERCCDIMKKKPRTPLQQKERQIYDDSTNGL